jgi:hypothetical protein
MVAKLDHPTVSAGARTWVDTHGFELVFSGSKYALYALKKNGQRHKFALFFIAQDDIPKLIEELRAHLPTSHLSA